jgi:hypothetical protein
MARDERKMTTIRHGVFITWTKSQLPGTDIRFDLRNVGNSILYTGVPREHPDQADSIYSYILYRL